MGFPTLGTFMQGWGCGWPLLGMGIMFLGVVWWHLWCSLGALSSSQPLCGMQGAVCPCPKGSIPSQSPARAVLPPPWLSHQQPQHLLCDQLYQAPDEGEDRRPGQLLGPGESGLQCDRSLQGGLVLCWGKLGCPQSQGPQLCTGAAPPPKPTGAMPAHALHPCQPQHCPCSH